jgi:hypothetical protein
MIKVLSVVCLAMAMFQQEKPMNELSNTGKMSDIRFMGAVAHHIVIADMNYLEAADEPNLSSQYAVVIWKGKDGKLHLKDAAGNKAEFEPK